MPFDAISLCEVKDLTDGKKQYIVKPEDKYPATVARIKEVLEGDIPAEAVMPHVAPDRKFDVMKNINRQLKKIPSEAWEWALIPVGQLSEPNLIVAREKTSDGEFDLSKADMRLRAVQAADKYFQRVLRAQIGGGAHGGPQLLRIYTLNYADA